MNLKPLGERLVVEYIKEEERTKSGILLPTSVKEEPQYAVVVSIGDAILDDEKKKDCVKVGDKVIFAKYSGTEVKLEDKEYTIVKFNDLQAVVEG